MEWTCLYLIRILFDQHTFLIFSPHSLCGADTTPGSRHELHDKQTFSLGLVLESFWKWHSSLGWLTAGYYKPRVTHGLILHCVGNNCPRKSLPRKKQGSEVVKNRVLIPASSCSTLLTKYPYQSHEIALISLLDRR